MKPIRAYSVSLVLCGVLAIMTATIGSADEKADAKDTIAPQAAEFFENRVRPVLFEKCFACHGAKQQISGIRVDSLAAMLKGSSGNPILVPGEVEKSLLVHVIRYDGKVKMPPSGKLKDTEIAAITEWVKMGAPWPGTKLSDARKQAAGAGNIAEMRLKHWAFRPVKKPVPPKVQTTTRVLSPVDRFVLTKLEAKNLTLAPASDRRTLLRRVTFGLTGLPPTAEELAAFLVDKSPNAFAKVVDRLLASPHYGERWARYWLDVARYADTKGYTFQEDSRYHNAYTYRDYVIRAFNEDLPYDRFLTEQLAADRLPGDDRRPLAALGFLTLGRRFLNDGVLIADDRIDVTMRGLMGLTVGCARCHDHKFDPIPTKDYYSLYGVFASSTEPNPAPGISPKSITEPYEAHNKKIFAAQQEIETTLHAQVNALRARVTKDPKSLPDSVGKTLQQFREGTLPNDAQQNALTAHFAPAAVERIKSLRSTIQGLQKTLPTAPEFACALVDMPTPVEPRVFVRGNPNNQGDPTPRQFLAVLSGPERKPFTNGSGRLELAQAIASKENPLTARVFVNRVWMYHFGAGLVRTPGDFGTRGEPPTHPELLDYLASRFMEEGWSIKKLHRMILLSAVYQQGNAVSPRATAIDPENRLLWKQNRQRLDLESLRDSLLAASGQMDHTIGGRSVEILFPPFTKRRSVYAYIERQNLPGLFRTFDFASPDTSSPQRYRTTVPQQALYMMNSPFVIEQAKALAARTEAKEEKGSAAPARPQTPAPSPLEARIRRLYRFALGRTPTKTEIALGLEFLSQPAEVHPAPIWQYGYGGFDEGVNRVTSFTPLTHFAEGGWRASATFPDPKLHYLMLMANGGHVGHDLAHAAIRRWTASADMEIRITGTLAHLHKEGDGVRGRIVSSRAGELGQWLVHDSRATTNVERLAVKKGDTLDFVTDLRETQDFDSFQWAPILRTLPGRGAKTVASAPEQVWSAEADFGGPVTVGASGLSIWEKYAQTLLMTNEFCFVD